MNIGSRPARRKAGLTVQGLRAIPWIFAWTQTRLILPSWLGVGEALSKAIAAGHKAELQAMYETWPFFAASVDLIEMILAKADLRISTLYDDVLVDDAAERKLGAELRERCNATIRAVLEVTGQPALLERNGPLKRLIHMRAPYMGESLRGGGVFVFERERERRESGHATRIQTLQKLTHTRQTNKTKQNNQKDPINVMQVEILRRLRADPDSASLRDALLITINGIAAGMRNTG